MTNVFRREMITTHPTKFESAARKSIPQKAKSTRRAETVLGDWPKLTWRLPLDTEPLDKSTEGRAQIDSRSLKIHSPTRSDYLHPAEFDFDSSKIHSPESQIDLARWINKKPTPMSDWAVRKSNSVARMNDAAERIEGWLARKNDSDCLLRWGDIG